LVETATDEALDQKVYSILRNAILERKLLPGTKISLLALSRELGVSRTPTRLAVQRLATEGLIIMMPNQAPRVAKPSVKNIEDVFYMRSLLEPAAASLASRFATAAELKKLETAIEQGYLAFKSRNLLDFLNNNSKIHYLIADMSRNEALTDAIKQFLDKSTIILSLFDPFYSYSEQEEYVSYQEDLAILEAIRIKDSKLAAKRMKKHILRAFKDLPLDSLDEVTRSFPRLK
jgi:DNA-binding GntR family transcriptional regulator